MSLAIEVDDVRRVLLSDGQWHLVVDKSFTTDSYEFVCGSYTQLGGGQCDLVPSTGFAFKDRDGQWVYGPLTAIQAVRTERD